MASSLDSTQAALESSIAKAREAQKKFEETKKTIEETKARIEAAVKKAKEAQQKIKEARALIKAGALSKDGIAAIIAGQMGMLKGKLVAQVQSRVLAILYKFASQCPNSKDLQKIIKIRSTLLKHLASFEKRVKSFSSIADKLTLIVSTLKILIEVITSIPLPTAIIPPMSGGIGIPVSIMTKYSNTLVKLNKVLDRFEGEAKAITSTISSVLPIITALKERLESIDVLIQQCSLGQPADLSQIVTTAQPPQNTGSEGTPTDAQGNPDPDYLYKGYVLAIVQDPDSPKVAPRRFATASDRTGIMKLRGQSSFSSSTQVLLDEIKFRIDNQFK